MDQDAIRRIMQLERQVRELQNELRQARARPRGAAGGISRLAILQAVSTIAGRTGPVSGVYNISHGPARIFDLLVRDTASAWEMSVVKAGSTERTVELGNLWSEDIAADTFVLGNSYEHVYLHGAEECDDS